MRPLLLLLLPVLLPAPSAAAEPASRPGVELITAQLRPLEVEPVGVGQRGELSLVLLERPDRALPLEIRVDVVDSGSGTGPEFDENRLDWSAVVDPLALQPRVRASFTAPSAPGRYEVWASVDYSICSEQWCRAKHGELRWTVLVEARPDEQD